MYNSSDDDDEHVIVSKTIFYIVLGVALMVGIGTMVSYWNAWWDPYFRNQEAKSIEHGYVAVSSKKELLQQLYQQYTKLESQRIESIKDPQLSQTYQSQQKAIVERMKVETANMTYSEIPVSVRDLIAN